MQKWRDHRTGHVILVLLVFTCTGLTVAKLGGWIAESVGLERFSFWYWFLWIVVLLPIYNVFLLVYAFIFGKFSYFRAKQKKMLRKLMFWRS